MESENELLDKIMKHQQKYIVKFNITNSCCILVFSLSLTLIKIFYENVWAINFVKYENKLFLKFRYWKKIGPTTNLTTKIKI